MYIGTGRFDNRSGCIKIYLVKCKLSSCYFLGNNQTFRTPWGDAVDVGPNHLAFLIHCIFCIPRRLLPLTIHIESSVSRSLTTVVSEL